ncbi:putative ribonuclease H-like domain-containing protein [Tanacetum coccineum]
MYSFDMKNIVPKDSLTCLVAKATSEESMLWHRRLGHINFKNINKLVKENLVRDLPLKRFENDQTCVACLKGKQHIASCKTKAFNPITKPLFMLHMDLFGPTFVSSLMHKKYCLVVTDDYSRFSWVFFLTTKDETSEILKNFIKEVENLVDKKVKIIRSDNGTEFKNKVMDDFCRGKGIKIEYSVVRTPQQNGVAKRKNRTLIDVARTIIEAIRIFLAYASYMGFMVYQMDVKSAFLYGQIEEEVYVCQPPGFEDPDHPNKVYKVVKALYGLHQAPRAWYDTLANYLLCNGFERGKIDQTLFIKRHKGYILLVQIYVDDIIFGSIKKELCDEFEKLMKDKFQMSSIGELTEKALVQDGDAADVDEHLYRSMIGSLMYLIASNPDIMFAVCAYARVKKLEAQIKIGKARRRAKIVHSDDEEIADDSSKQGRILSDAEVQEKASNETEPVIQDVTPTKVIQDQESSEKGSDEVSTAGAKKGTASEEVPILDTAERGGFCGVRKGKVIMIESESQEKSRKSLKQERIKFFAEAIRLEDQKGFNCKEMKKLLDQWMKKKRLRAMAEAKTTKKIDG